MSRIGAFSSLVLLIMSACIAIPHRGKMHAPGGSAGSVDLRFLKVGPTARDEVRKGLELVDVHLADDRVFWGRWRREWNVYWVAAGAAETSATASAGTVTVWRRRNVIVRFDSSGKVAEFQAVGDAELLPMLASVVRTRGIAAVPALDELALTTTNGERILLAGGRVLFSGIRTGQPRFACEFDRLKRLSVTSDSTERAIGLRLEAATNARPGRFVHRVFALEPKQVYDLVRYMEANNLARALGRPRERATEKLRGKQ